MLKKQLGFTLTELAVAFLILSLLIATAMSTLTSQADIRDVQETNRRLNSSVDAIIGFAIVNRRLPCPAVSATTGVEAPVGGGNCTTYYNGFLPGSTLGYQPTDDSGYAVDAWGNRIRYAVSGVTPTGCTGTSNTPHFTSQTNLKGNGVSCKPNDLDIICSTVSAGVNATCNSTVHVAAQQTIAFVVFSVGKNGSLASNYGVDEIENTNADAKFVSRAQSDTSSTSGTYDDLVVYVPAGVLYQKLIAAGALP